MRDEEYRERQRLIRGVSDHWINRGKDTDTEHMYCDLYTSIRDSILLLAEVIQGRPTDSN